MLFTVCLTSPVIDCWTESWMEVSASIKVKDVGALMCASVPLSPAVTSCVCVWRYRVVLGVSPEVLVLPAAVCGPDGVQRGRGLV